jgi:glycine/D-amino acid oxidase-like deaminating enzyme
MSSFRRDAAGRLIIGAIGSLDHVGSDIHRHWASRKLAALFPQLAGQPLQHAWFGNIAMTSDHLPKIQRLGENAFSVFGYSGRGIGPGTAFGKALAMALASGDQGDLPLQPVEKYGESWTSMKRDFYELGASAFHLIDSR